MVQENMKAFGTMAEKETPKTKETQPEIKGTLTYEDKVVQKIVGLALESVDGLLSVEGGFFSNLTGKLINTDDVTTGVDVEVLCFARGGGRLAQCAGGLGLRPAGCPDLAGRGWCSDDGGQQLRRL